MRNDSLGMAATLTTWIENRVMIERLTLDMARDYLAATKKFFMIRFS